MYCVLGDMGVYMDDTGVSVICRVWRIPLNDLRIIQYIDVKVFRRGKGTCE